MVEKFQEKSYLGINGTMLDSKGLIEENKED